MNAAIEAAARSCESCVYWVWIAENMGACRTKAPVVIGGLHGPSETAWPETESTDWCGEYKATELEGK